MMRFFFSLFVLLMWLCFAGSAWAQTGWLVSSQEASDVYCWWLSPDTEASDIDIAIGESIQFVKPKAEKISKIFRRCDLPDTNIVALARNVGAKQYWSGNITVSTSELFPGFSATTLAFKGRFTSAGSDQDIVIHRMGFGPDESSSRRNAALKIGAEVNRFSTLFSKTNGSAKSVVANVELVGFPAEGFLEIEKWFASEGIKARLVWISSGRIGFVLSDRDATIAKLKSQTFGSVLVTATTAVGNSVVVNGESK